MLTNTAARMLAMASPSVQNFVNLLAPCLPNPPTLVPALSIMIDAMAASPTFPVDHIPFTKATLSAVWTLRPTGGKFPLYTRAMVKLLEEVRLTVNEQNANQHPVRRTHLAQALMNFFGSSLASWKSYITKLLPIIRKQQAWYLLTPPASQSQPQPQQPKKAVRAADPFPFPLPTAKIARRASHTNVGTARATPATVVFPALPALVGINTMPPPPARPTTAPLPQSIFGFPAAPQQLSEGGEIEEEEEEVVFIGELDLDKVLSYDAFCDPYYW